MSTNYPGALDSLVNPTATDTLDSATVPHATQHADANDAIEAIEVTLGVNPQGGSATVVARLTALDSTVAGKAATNQTMYVGTTAVAINRSSASLALTGVSIDGNAATATSATSATSATTAGSVTNGVYTNVSNTFTTGTQIIATGADGTVGFRIKRNSATQTANLLEVTQSDGTTILAKIDSAGAITTASGLTASGAITTSGDITVTGGGGSIRTTGLASYISANAYIQTPQFVAGASASATPGTILINGATSGTATLNVPTTAGGTHTFPATGGTVVNSGTTTLPSGITSIPNVTTANGLTSASSLTTVGTIGSGTWQGSDIGILYGGTGHDYGSPLVGKAVLVTSPTKATNDTTPEAVFRTSAGTIQYFNVEADTTYAFEGMLQLNTKASGTAAAPRLSLIYVATGSTSTLTEQSARLIYNSNRTLTSFNGSGGINAANTNADDSLTSTAATTYHINFRGFIRTNATTAGRINLGATQSVAGTSAAPDFILGSFMNFYKVGSGATNTFGNWTA